MKYILKTSIVLLLSTIILNTVIAQILNPVKWAFSTKKTTSCEFELVLTAQIEASWHLYGQKLILSLRAGHRQLQN